MNKQLADIPDYPNWRLIKKVEEGWSKDEKYYVENHEGTRLLLRITGSHMFDVKKKEFEMIQTFNTLDILMSEAISFGFCNDNRSVYLLLSWVDGLSLQEALKQLPEEEQYAIGVQAGRILKALHAMSVNPEDIPAEDKKVHKLRKLDTYVKSSVRVENDQPAIDYVRNNLHKINPLPPVYKHGDFHVGNLILSDKGKVGVIDFNRWNCGDRYEEFYKIQNFDVEVSIPFSVGQVDGYFNNEPPVQFWDVLAVYAAHSALCLINWAEKFNNRDEVSQMQQRCLQTFRDYDYFQTSVPHWYSDHYRKFRN
ncbi:aminoglycoside phosphotransferase family protein [Paenibacillus chitinolyticus]|uniref:aminoglycoside phosphotransferase family protein n=1 Tax=Paenibacillus chitinolyticus TaxID=79263 RepID=UPI003671645E